MIKHLALATLGLMAVGAAAIAQNVDQAAVKLEVVVSRYQGETKVQSLPFAFRLQPNQQGTLRIGTDLKDLPPAESVPCITPASLQSQQVGTQVDSKVTPGAAGEFQVSLTVTERALAGCRTVGNIDIPVFSNRIVSHVFTLKNGESTELVQGGDSARNTSTRLAVTLMPVEK